MSMNWQDIIVIIIGVVTTLLVIRYIVQLIRGKDDAKCSGCNNGNCSKNTRK